MAKKRSVWELMDIVLANNLPAPCPAHVFASSVGGVFSANASSKGYIGKVGPQAGYGGNTAPRTDTVWCKQLNLYKCPLCSREDERLRKDCERNWDGLWPGSDQTISERQAADTHGVPAASSAACRRPKRWTMNLRTGRWVRAPLAEADAVVQRVSPSCAAQY